MAKEEEELVPVEEPTKTPPVEEADEGEEASASDERVGQDDESSLTDEEREERRRDRKERKERQREARDRDKRELNFLRKRNEDLEQRFSQLDQRVAATEVSSIDSRIAYLKNQINVADQVHAKAVADGAGEDATEALRIRDELKAGVSRLEQAKRQVVSTSRAAPTQDPPEVDPDLKRNALSWMERHPWYRTDRSDEDSAIVGAIDDRLIAEGFDPTTKNYWDELTRRVKRRLPDRFKEANGHDEDEDGSEEEAPRRSEASGPRFATGGKTRALKKNEVYVSPERKAAMIEAGVWDDPVLRTKYLKRYQEWDRTNKRNAN